MRTLLMIVGVIWIAYLVVSRLKAGPRPSPEEVQRGEANMVELRQRMKSLQENTATTPDGLRRRLDDMKALKRLFDQDPGAFAEHQDILRHFDEDLARLQGTIDSQRGA